MGGGTSIVSAYYGIPRKVELTKKAIERTGQTFGVSFREVQDITVKVVSQKKWTKKPEVMAYHTPGAVVMRRDVFAGKKHFSAMTHEILHDISGAREYYSHLGREFEEGMVEYLAQSAAVHGFKGPGKRYATVYPVYSSEVKAMGMLMGLVGRKKLVYLWHEGFLKDIDTPYNKQLYRIAEKEKQKYWLASEGIRNQMDDIDNRIKRLEKEKTKPKGFDWEFDYELKSELRSRKKRLEEKEDRLWERAHKAEVKWRASRKMGFQILAKAVKKEGFTDTANFILEKYAERHKSPFEQFLPPSKTLLTVIRKEILEKKLPVTLPLLPHESEKEYQRVRKILATKKFDPDIIGALEES